MIRLMVDNFMSRSKMEGRSMVAICGTELRRTGAAYWAEASQTKMQRAKHSRRRLRAKGQRMAGGARVGGLIYQRRGPPEVAEVGEGDVARVGALGVDFGEFGLGAGV